MIFKVRPLIELKKGEQSKKIDWTDTENLFAWAAIIFAVGYIFIYHGIRFLLK